MSANSKPGSKVRHAVHWFDKPKPIPLDALTQNFIGLVLLTAIVNPFGPTMKGLAVISDVPLPAPPTNLQIVRFYLNPFGHAIESIGLLDGSSTTIQVGDELLSNIDRLGYDGSGCFTFFHPGYLYAGSSTAVQLARALLFRVEGLARELDFLRRFPSDPWRRITAEVDDAVQPLRDPAAGKHQPPGDEKHQAPSSEDVERFLEIIQRNEHNAEEWKVLFAAWKGAIENTPPGAFSDVLTVEMIIYIYAHLVNEPGSKKAKPREKSSDSTASTAFAHLNRIYENRMAGSLGKEAFCVFMAGKVYVQFLASWDEDTFQCEAASVKSVPEIGAIFTTQADDVLRKLGFKPPKVSPNYSQAIKIEGVNDLGYAARLAFRVLKQVYRITDLSSAAFKEFIPARAGVSPPPEATERPARNEETAAQKFKRLVAGIPRFVEVKNTGKAFVIVGAKPPTKR